MVNAENSVSITEADFDISREYQEVQSKAPHAGAIVSFVGLVRDLYDDKSESANIEYIELSHYSGMSETLCQDILDQASERFDVDAIQLVHRVGRLAKGEQIVSLIVASRHRQQGFAAAEFVMDYLKNQAPFWKKEVGDRGEQWLGLKEKDQQAYARWQQNDK